MFCNLHVHDAKGSLLDSILTVKQIAEFARDNNQEAIAITNHGYMTSYVDFVKECNRCGIKPIIGNEVYEVDDMGEKCDTKEYRQPRYHLVLLARSQQGFQNLIKITSVACTEGLYKKPRIDIDYIQTHNLGKGIICLTACMAGRLSRLLVDNKTEEALAYYTKLSDTFDSVYCELQSHNTESQAFANKCIYEFCKNNELSYVITTDAHMLSKDMLEAHSYFIEIAEDREVGESYTDCYLQTETDVYNTLKDQFSEQIIQIGIENTYAIANSIENINIGLGQGNQMPVVKVDGDFKSHEEYLRHLVFSTFDEKFGHMSEDEQKVRRGRLDFELDVLYKVEYTDYFIMLYMLAKEARKRHIPLGYSRGSGANCLCLFMLNVTQVDSVRWGLDFSRFANLGRTSLADYDWDISKRRRKEMVKISEELFGKDNVAPIATFNTLSTKVAIRDIGKVLNEKETSPYFGQIPYSLRNEVASALPTIKTLDDLGEEVEKEILLKDYVSKDERLQRVYEQFPLWFKYVMAVEGLPKSLGRHAAGTLITPKPITDYCPICFDSEKNVMIQLEMHNAMDDLGLVKMDYLGLENLDIIDDTLKLCNLTWQDVDINHLDLADKEVFDNVYKQGHTIGIFQMESAEARKMCIEAQADNIDDIIAINAANRPATKDSFPTYCENKLHPENVKLIHEDLRQFFSNTQYILLYQEQALQLFRYAGFPESEVDNARRAIGKKLADKMAQLQTDFTKGLANKNWTEEQINSIWDLLLKQSTYSFNKGHSTAYGLLSYLTAYLKTHYPVEFMTALLTSRSDKIEKISATIDDCRRMNIQVCPPNVNKSDGQFTVVPNENKILFGLLGIKGLGESVVDEIIKNRPYKNFDDFTSKITNTSAIVTLIKAGAIPTKNKMSLLRKYAEKINPISEYSPVSTLPTYKKLEEMGIDVDSFREGKKVDKERLLAKYNSIRKKAHYEQQNIKHHKAINEFREKYAQDEFLWEFQTLSMFLSNDPLLESKQYISSQWQTAEAGSLVLICCVITDIKKKKDKNGNQFAYLDLYTSDGMVEATIWSSQFKKYADIVKKSSCVIIKARKNDGYFVDEMKLYSQWLNERKLKK